MAEAAAQFQKGLDQLTLLPDTPERQRQELEFWSAQGAVLIVVKGHAAPEAGQAYARARALWEALGSFPEFLQIPCGQSMYYMFNGEFDLAQRLAEDLLRLSRQRDDTAGLILGHYASGLSRFFVGRFALSRSHLEEVVALYDPVPHGSLVNHAGIHPHLASGVYLTLGLFCLGYPDQALSRMNSTIAGARKLAHPPTLAANLAVCTRLLFLLAETAALEERASQLVAVATEQGLLYWSAQGTIYRGWVKVKKGDVTEGISLLRSGSIACRATGTEALMPFHIAL